MQKLLAPLGPSKKRPDLTELNPEFGGIGKQLNKSHLNRKQAEKVRKEKINRVSYLRKEEDMAQKKLMKKQRQLQTLMNVIARKQMDSIEKEERRRAKQEAEAIQREMNLRRRSEHQQRLRNAFLSLYDEHQSSVNKMQQTSRRYNDMMQSHKKSTMREKHEKVFRISKEKEEGREKIKGYLKERVDLFTSRYKKKIQQEEEAARRYNEQTKELSEQEGQVSLRLESSLSRMEALNDQIIKTTLESRVLAGNNSWGWSALSKNYHTIDTKQESINNTEAKVQKLLERELDDSSFSKQ